MDRILCEWPAPTFKGITGAIGELRVTLSGLGVAAKITHAGNRYDRETGKWVALLEIDPQPAPGHNVVEAAIMTKVGVAPQRTGRRLIDLGEPK